MDDSRKARSAAAPPFKVLSCEGGVQETEDRCNSWGIIVAWAVLDDLCDGLIVGRFGKLERAIS